MALFLTQSRGAVGATFVACVVAVALMSTRRLTADKPSEEFVAWRRYATIIAGLLVVVGLFALFAGRSVYRMQEQGSEDTRWCAFSSTIAAIKDNWIFGAGFGAFQDVFPVYRNSDCAGIFGVWDRAHNFFLEGWLGLGLPFLVALAIGYLVLIAAFIRGVKVRHKFRFIPVMGLAALILASLHSIVDFSLQIPGVGVYFAAIMAATVTVSLGRGERLDFAASARTRRRRAFRRETLREACDASAALGLLAFIALTWLVGGASAQQIGSGRRPVADPTLAPAPAGSAAPEAAGNDDPTDSVNWRDRVAAARRRHADWAACVAAKRRDCAEARRRQTRWTRCSTTKRWSTATSFRPPTASRSFAANRPSRIVWPTSSSANAHE